MQSMKAKSAHHNIWVAFVLLLLIAAFLGSSCKSGGSSGGSLEGSGGGSGGGLPPKILSWRPPVRFADGGGLDPAQDLSYYEIYINESGNFLSNDSLTDVVSAVDPSTGNLVTSFDLTKVSPPLLQGQNYFVTMRTVEKNGGKSDFMLPPTQFVY